MWKRKVFVSTATFMGGYLILWPNKNLKVFLKSAYQDEKIFQKQEPATYIFLPENPGGDCYDDEQSTWLPYLRSNSSIHWKFLMLSKSKSRSVRHRAIKSCAELPILDKWQHRIIAQACDSRTAIGLARLSEISESFFLPPPFKDLTKENFKHDLLQLLLSLPTLNADLCLKILSQRVTSLAHQFLKKQEELNSELEDSYAIYHSERKKRAALNFEKLCLQALLGHSSIRSHRCIMFEKGILKLLLTVWKYHENDAEFQSMIGQILANFALEEKYEAALHGTGWIGILASWSKSPHIDVSLPAAKALANLDRDDFFHSYYDNGVYLLHPLVRQRKEVCADIIFVHGLLGATFWTWRQHDSIKKSNSDYEKKDADCNLLKPAVLSSNHHQSQSYTFCWPKDWLSAEFPNTRLISIDYNTRISKWGAHCPQEEKKDTLDAKASNLIDKLLISNVGEKPIIWISHSMGGLLVKQILLLAAKSKENRIKSIAQKTKGVIFFSVPHKGSDLANIFQSASYIFQPSIDMRQLYKGSPILLALNEHFKDKIVLQNGVDVLSFGETVKSRWGLTLSLVVSEDSSDPGFGEFYALPVDHLSTCKPESPETESYSKIVEFLHLNISQALILPNRYSKLDLEVSNILCLIP